MIYQFFLISLLIGIMLPVSADFDTGIAAYRKDDYASAMRELTPLARKGNAEASAILGSMYAKGQGVAQDYNVATEWYRKAADANDSIAQYRLAQLYDEGKGVKQNLQKAAYWYRRAAEQGHSASQFCLAHLYRTGEGVPRDFEKSVKWYRKAAYKGYAPAQSDLGYMYGTGRGIYKDYVMAYTWYNIAATTGDKSAIKNRDAVTESMNLLQIERAQLLSRVLYSRYGSYH